MKTYGWKLNSLVGNIRALRLELLRSTTLSPSCNYIRRSLISLQEFRSAFEAVQMSSEFKKHLPVFSQRTSKSVHTAKTYFLAKGKEIKNLRNEIGGHYKPDTAEYAVTHLPAGAVGTVEWDSNNAPFALRIHLAADILAAGLDKTFGQQADTIAELHRIIGMIGEGYRACQEATYALYVEFVWPKLTERERYDEPQDSSN